MKTGKGQKIYFNEVLNIENNIPKVFISYSWESKEHSDWVKSLADKLLADGILQSRYFEDLKNSWKDLDIVVVGIGDFSNKGKHQWLDMLTEDDFKELTKVKTVGEICYRFFDSKGKEVYENLQERTIAISLED